MITTSFGRRATLAAVLAATLQLAACGGGGGGDAAGSATDAASAQASAVATVSAIDKYAGSFVSASCLQSSGASVSATGAPLYERTTFTSLSKASATRLMLQIKHELFAASDCSGTPAATLTVSGPGTTLDLAATGAGPQGSDKVQIAESNRMPGISAVGSVAINGVRYTNNYLAAYVDYQVILLNGTDLFVGNLAGPVDVQQYPTALLPNVQFRKQ